MTAENKIRYSLIDALRGFAVINMIAFHLCYNIFCVFGVDTGFNTNIYAVIWERFICCAFIILSGVSMNFSRRGYLRGIVVSLCGVAVTAVTVWLIPEQAIWFGVLSLLGCAMIISFALRGVLDRLHPLAGVMLFFLLFMLCYGVPKGYIGVFSFPLLRLPEALYRYTWAAFLGFPPEGFLSADYFPLLPWLFLFITGYHLWRVIADHGWDRLFLKKLPFLDFIGRHSLLIYMEHQPVLYGICLLIFSTQK